MTLEQAIPTASTVADTGVHDAMRNRRTGGTFRPDLPSRELLESLVEAARWAPNHHLTEPWRFIIVTGDARRDLAEAMVTELSGDATDAAKAEREAIGIRTKVVRSPVIIVVAQTGRPDNPEKDLEDYAACACATQNLLLAAHAEGLAAKWSTGKAAISPAAKAFLGLDPSDRLVAYVYLGYPADEARDSRRRPVEDVTRWVGWDG
jgi:nitroreductase